jgi:hypothetical protein
MDKRFGGPQSQSGHDSEEKNSQPPPGIEPRSSDRDVQCRIILKCVLERCDVKLWNGFTWLRKGASEYHKEPYGSIKVRNFITGHQIFKDDRPLLMPSAAYVARS